MRLLSIFGAVLFVAACSGSEEEPATTDPNAPPAPVVPGAPTSENAPSKGESSASDPSAPGEALPPAPPNAGVFVGGPDYQALLGPSTIDVSGKGNGHLSFSKDGNPAGKACLDCHDGAGKGGAPAFVFAGSIFSDAAGTKPAPRIEVRLVAADGKALTTYTDDNGNFFFRNGAGLTGVPAMAGARSATASRTMVNKINDGNCNQCHGSTARITL